MELRVLQTMSEAGIACVAGYRVPGGRETDSAEVDILGVVSRDQLTEFNGEPGQLTIQLELFCEAKNFGSDEAFVGLCLPAQTAIQTVSRLRWGGVPCAGFVDTTALQAIAPGLKSAFAALDAPRLCLQWSTIRGSTKNPPSYPFIAEHDGGYARGVENICRAAAIAALPTWRGSKAPRHLLLKIPLSVLIYGGQKLKVHSPADLGIEGCLRWRLQQAVVIDGQNHFRLVDVVHESELRSFLDECVSAAQAALPVFGPQAQALHEAAQRQANANLEAAFDAAQRRYQE